MQKNIIDEEKNLIMASCKLNFPIIADAIEKAINKNATHLDVGTKLTLVGIPQKNLYALQKILFLLNFSSIDFRSNDLNRYSTETWQNFCYLLRYTAHADLTGNDLFARQTHDWETLFTTTKNSPLRSLNLTGNGLNMTQASFWTNLYEHSAIEEYDLSGNALENLETKSFKEFCTFLTHPLLKKISLKQFKLHRVKNDSSFNCFLSAIELAHFTELNLDNCHLCLLSQDRLKRLFEAIKKSPITKLSLAANKLTYYNQQFNMLCTTLTGSHVTHIIFADPETKLLGITRERPPVFAQLLTQKMNEKRDKLTSLKRILTSNGNKNLLETACGLQLFAARTIQRHRSQFPNALPLPAPLQTLVDTSPSSTQTQMLPPVAYCRKPTPL